MVVFVSSDKNVLSVILKHGTIELKSLKKESGIPERTLRNIIKRLKSHGIIEERILLRDLRKKVIAVNGGGFR